MSDIYLVIEKEDFNCHKEYVRAAYSNEDSAHDCCAELTLKQERNDTHFHVDALRIDEVPREVYYG